MRGSVNVEPQIRSLQRKVQLDIRQLHSVIRDIRPSVIKHCVNLMIFRVKGNVNVINALELPLDFKAREHDLFVTVSNRA